MKVYTHYYKVKDAENTEFRWRTLLQFGDTWDVIGSVVIQNPGSSKPKKKDDNGDAIPISDENILSELKAFDASDNKWYEFDTDQTMKRIKNLFGCYYGTENLQGVIQIFNIFYIKDKKIEKAIEKYKKFRAEKDFFESAKKSDEKCPFENNEEFYEKVLEKDFENLMIPIYLGFADLGTNEKKYEGMFTERCKDFFYKSKDLGMKYCSEKFEDNKFYHPLYLMFYGKNKLECQTILQDFINSKEKAKGVSLEQIRVLNKKSKQTSPLRSR